VIPLHEDVDDLKEKVKEKSRCFRDAPQAVFGLHDQVLSGPVHFHTTRVGINMGKGIRLSTVQMFWELENVVNVWPPTG
jgi:hypothetical protein